MVTKCALGQHLFGGKLGRCPALKPDATGYHCDVVADPAQYSIRTALYGVDKMREAALQILYAGEGCDARFNNKWINEKFHRECEKRDAVNLPKRQAALRLWGIE
jgi:hypothetical protein